LEMTLLVAPLFAISFFWVSLTVTRNSMVPHRIADNAVAVDQFGWTSYPNVHWASPMCAGGLLGFAVLGIFVSLFNYVSLVLSTKHCRS
jgi:hypothetical protein